MLAIWDALGQLTWATGLGALVLTGLAVGFGDGLGAGFGFDGTGAVTVLVTVLVVVDAGDELADPTQTVTDPDPIFEP
jgi:hypothetical protein